MDRSFDPFGAVTLLIVVVALAAAARPVVDQRDRPVANGRARYGYRPQHSRAAYAGATATTAVDNVGTMNLTAVGSPVYTILPIVRCRPVRWP